MSTNRAAGLPGGAGGGAAGPRRSGFLGEGGNKKKLD